MKKIIAIVASVGLLTALTGCLPFNKKENVTEYKYEGKGQLKTSINYDYTDNAWIQKTKTESTYDDKGNLLHVATYKLENDNWKNDSWETYTYDDNGLLVELQSYYKMTITTNTYEYYYKTEYVYENSNLVSMTKYSKDNKKWEFASKKEYEYDANNNVIVELYTYEILSKMKKIKYEYAYDSNNLKISSKTYEEDDNGNLRSDPSDKTTYEYDANKHLIKETEISKYFYIATTTKDEKIYTYDGDNLIEVVSYMLVKDGEENDPWTKTTYTYDANGNKISVISYQYDSENKTYTSRSKELYTYNENNEEITDVYYTVDSTTNEFIEYMKTETSYTKLGE